MSSSSRTSFTVRPPQSQASSRQPSSGPESDSSSSFKRPPLLPRHISSATAKSSPLARAVSTSNGLRRAFSNDSDSDDPDGAGHTEDELVSGFDEFGVQRSDGRIDKPAVPLVIPALANRDWRAIAIARKQGPGRYIPQSSRAAVENHGDGNGTVSDVMNAGPQAVGLVIKSSVPLTQPVIKVEATEPDMTKMDVVTEESEDERARRALLASLNGDDDGETKPLIDIIPIQANAFAVPKDETDAYRQDVVTRPDSATLDDYARVPIDQFGAAMLRGMGWKEGMAASRTRAGPSEPYAPVARPALLGIGAKERAAEDIPLAPGAKPKAKRGKPDMKYVPLVRKEKSSASSSAAPSRSVSPSRGTHSTRRSPSPSRSFHDRRDSDRRSRDTTDGRTPDRRRDGDRYNDREKHRDSRHGDHRSGDREGYHDSGRDHESRRDRSRDRDRRRDSEHRSGR